VSGLAGSAFVLNESPPSPVLVRAIRGLGTPTELCSFGSVVFSLKHSVLFGRWM